MILCVDLAAKFSAWNIVDAASGDLVDQGHSWGSSPFQFAHILAHQFSTLPVSSNPFMVIEDMPFNVGQTKLVRDVYRLQGMIVQLVQEYHESSRIVWIPPALWQFYFKSAGMRKGNKSDAKLVASEKYGYEAPQLLHKDLHGVDRQHARKTMEDYVDAFLISRYMVEVGQEHGSVAKAIEEIPRLERYGHAS